jgi:hypothetical protein
MTKEIDKAQKYLLENQNKDGGWGYYSGKNSSPEPTIYSILALCKGSTECTQAAQKGLDWLAGQTKPNGALSLPGQKDDHWTTLLYLIPLTKLKSSTKDDIEKVTQWAFQYQSKTVINSKENKLDGSIVGWCWAPNTFGWVEPTAYGVLALKMAGHSEHKRVRDGIRLILDRVCNDGGWNYGNREVLGHQLTSYVSTTAYALMALQKESSAEDARKKGLDYLQKEILTNLSTLNLSLTILCFDIFGQNTESLLEHLIKRQTENGSWRDNAHLTALSILAIQAANKSQNASGESRNAFLI